jgi:hypothetical protein
MTKFLSILLVSVPILYPRTSGEVFERVPTGYHQYCKFMLLGDDLF